MQQIVRVATFNAFNLAPPGARLYDNLPPATLQEYEAKLNWTAQQLDRIDADLIGFQEIFSQEVLGAVLARTKRYRHAAQLGFDPAPAPARLTPSVALVSTLPVLGLARACVDFPDGLAQMAGSGEADRFTRPPLHVRVLLAPGCEADVIVVHLKSKRPDYRNGDNGDDPRLYAQACLRSLVRRGAEAVALRVLLCDLAVANTGPRIVLGDFNDVADADTTGIVLGAGTPLPDRMFDAFRLQPDNASTERAYSCLYENHATTIDHILVSGQFNRELPDALGEVLNVRYLNEHLMQGDPAASDHGQVLATLRLFGATT